MAAWKRVQRVALASLACLIATDVAGAHEHDAAMGAVETVSFDSGGKTLRGYLYKPAGSGPFPTVLYNHGSSPGTINNAAFELLGPMFVAHGWAFFAPYRRGQGLSSDAGEYIGDAIAAARAKGGLPVAADTMVRLLSTDHLQDQLAALSWLRTQSFVTPGQIAVMGNSFGGVETVLGAEHGGYCAAVDASGGAESWDLAPSLRSLMVHAVLHAKAPILFFQAENDYTVAPSRELYAAMREAKKPAEIRLYPPYGTSPEDGHSFPYRGADIWRDDVFRFLDKNCRARSESPEGNLMKTVMRRSPLSCLLALISAGAYAGDGNSEFSGRWEVTTTRASQSFVAGLNLAVDAGQYTGRSGYLLPDGYFYRYTGNVEADALHLKILTPDGQTGIGDLVLTAKHGALSGKGNLHDFPITVSARRPLQRPASASTVHDYAPRVFYTAFSGANPPALHVFPGDTVRTQTVDADGGGESPVQRTPSGNPQTGPFYIEGAMIGDTIAVHFRKIRPNRDTAFQQRAALDPHVLPPGYGQEPNEQWSNIWKLDREHGTATPANPSEKLKNLTVHLVPMLGCVGVAPYWSQAISTSDLGRFGGNLDYNQVREGTTVYLPVYQAGALLSVGDGHAVQGDGEITGQGLETSMDVEFTVDLIKDQLLDQPWAENEEYIMVSGVGGSLNDAAQVATAGLSNWLKSYYRLNASETATVLANSIHYDIAEMVDPETHVVAKMRKDFLAQLPKPPPPSFMFCQAAWGCLTQ